MSRPRFLAALLTAVFVGFTAGGGGPLSLAILTDSENNPSTFTSAVKFDIVAPTVTASVISKTPQYTPGYIRQAGTYYIYANVTDAGNPPSGVSTVTADVSTITTGQTAVALAAGSYSVGGVSYGYRSASVTANNPLTAGSYSYSVTATDASANSATQSGLTVTVDNTVPTGSAIQTANGSTTAGKAELGDTVTYTFSEPIDPQSILAGWTGASTSVVVRINNNASIDTLLVFNAANTTQLPLGSLNLRGDYLAANRTFGASGTASTMVLSGNSIIVTLGTASGTTNTVVTANNMTWTPAAGALDRAGNACTTTAVTEGGASDVEF